MARGLLHFHVIEGDNERKGKPVFLKKKKLEVIESTLRFTNVFISLSFVQ